MNYLQELWAALDFGSLRDILLRLASVFLCLTTHETCHGLAAYALGDPTAKRMHRLSLNPLRHIDWMGLLMMVTLGFGWAKPVPVDTRYFKKPKQSMAITTLARPASNYVLAYVSTIIYSMLFAVAQVKGESTGLSLALTFFSLLSSLNIGLGIFNLIPFPPLDGSKELDMFLPDRWNGRWMQLERYGMIVLMAALWFGLLDGFLMAARNLVLNAMLNGANFAYLGMLSLLTR